LAENRSLDRVALVLIHEDPRLEIMPHDRRDLLHSQLQRSISGEQDVTSAGRGEYRAEQRGGGVTDRAPDEGAGDVGSIVGQRQAAETRARRSIFDDDYVARPQKTLNRLPIHILCEGLIRWNERRRVDRTSRLALPLGARRRRDDRSQQLR